MFVINSNWTPNKKGGVVKQHNYTTLLISYTHNGDDTHKNQLDTYYEKYSHNQV